MENRIKEFSEPAGINLLSPASFVYLKNSDHVVMINETRPVKDGIEYDYKGSYYLQDKNDERNCVYFRHNDIGFIIFRADSEATVI